MLWSKAQTFKEEPFYNEAELENAICEAALVLFGPSRIYLNIKKKVGAKGKTRNVPDGFLLDLASAKQPRLFVVEVELAQHDPLKHVAIQILEFSLSFETSPQTVKSAIKEAMLREPAAVSLCQNYISRNGFENIDFLLEQIIYSKDSFNALVIIDELPDELEKVLISRFKFPVEILTFARYRNASGERIYKFEPFLEDITSIVSIDDQISQETVVDIAELDTIVVPAREDGFQETFLGEKRWYSIRIHSSMLKKIKYIAAYRTAPESSITHIAEVESIEQWQDTNKYVLNFAAPAQPIRPIHLVPKGRVKAPQAPRYTTRVLLMKAKNLDEAF
ncbi:MAG: hypothetical protein Q8O92_09780 [Candidatus Latescibacter sp.]|nr:hypothetical protein [Candidatus Latescibacter sp.]